MRQVTLFQTDDGKLHDTERQAELYLANQLGAVIDAITNKLIHIQKIGPMRQFLENETELFRKLVSITDEINHGTQSED